MKGWLAALFRRRGNGGKPHEEPLPAGAQGQSVGATSKDWHSGQTLLDDFVVERVLGQGGMGKVYLLKSQTTGTRFAVKRAKGLSERERRNFLAELQTWIDLPEHPNLVPCRFFRTVGDEVLIFAEYVESGSLKDWIDSRKLYEGGAEKTLERILDTAIQFAWGLHCVHELGLVHQDVKPANVMMEKDAQVAVQGLKVRVTDYGLARARAAAGERYLPELGQSILVSSGGYTPAYCSPEQADGRKLDRRTDVWSWGVSVLEMFQGGVAWQSGRVAAQALKAFLENNGVEEDIPAMPESVAELLERCFHEDPAQRWQSLKAVVQNLKGVYEAAVGTEYVRALGEIGHRTTTQLGAGDRRTRHGGSWEDPKQWLELALLAAGRDPTEAAEIVARQGSSRRGQLVGDVAAYDEARRMYERLIKAGRKDLENELATLCHHAAFVHETSDDSSGTVALYDRAIEIRERLVNVEGQRELSDDLVTVYVNKALAVSHLGNNREAVRLYDQAIEICEPLVNVEGRHELANTLATLYMNKAIAVSNLGDNLGAVALYDRAIEIFERLVNIEGRRELANTLATFYMNKAIAVNNLGDSRAAVGSYDRAIEIRERLVNGEGRGELANDLAILYMNKAIAVRDLGGNQETVPLYDRAIEILERLVNIEGRRELANGLATLYMNKAIAVRNLGDNPAAVGLYDRAIDIFERLINVEGRRELANTLATFYMNKAIAVRNLGDNRAAVGLYDQAIEIRERLVNVEGRHELANDLATLYIGKAIAFSLVRDKRTAVGLYDRAIEIRERLVNVEGQRELAGDLATVKTYRGLALIELGDTEAGKQEAREAMAALRAEVNRTNRADLKASLDWIATRLDE
jgi:tetratricopeptide (TPR) repeat protein